MNSPSRFRISVIVDSLPLAVCEGSYGSAEPDSWDWSPLVDDAAEPIDPATDPRFPEIRDAVRAAWTAHAAVVADH